MRHLHRGNLRLALGQEKPAGDDLQAAQALYEPLHQRNPDQVEFRSNLASAQSGLASLLLHREAEEGDHAHRFRPCRCPAEAAGRAPQQQLQREQLALVQRPRRGPLCLRRSGSSETQRRVEKDLREAVDLLAPLASRAYQAVPEYRVQLADVHFTLAIFYRQTGRPREAAAAWLDVIAARTSLAHQYPDRPEHRAQLAVAHGQRAQLLVSNRVAKVNEAVAEWQKAIDLQTKLIADRPKERDGWAKLAATYVDRIALWKSQARAAEAEKGYRALAAVLAERLPGLSRGSDLSGGPGGDPLALGRGAASAAGAIKRPVPASKRPSPPSARRSQRHRPTSAIVAPCVPINSRPAITRAQAEARRRGRSGTSRPRWERRSDAPCGGRLRHFHSFLLRLS